MGNEAKARDPRPSSEQDTAGGPERNQAQAFVEGRDGDGAAGEERGGEGASDVPAAGPHAEPEQLDEIVTPGAGALSPAGRADDVDPGTS